MNTAAILFGAFTIILLLVACYLDGIRIGRYMAKKNLALAWRDNQAMTELELTKEAIELTKEELSEAQFTR
jgi:hypothetical protein